MKGIGKPSKNHPCCLRAVYHTNHRTHPLYTPSYGKSRKGFRQYFVKFRAAQGKVHHRQTGLLAAADRNASNHVKPLESKQHL